MHSGSLTFSSLVNNAIRGDNQARNSCVLCFSLEMNMGNFPGIIKQVLILLGIAFFFYAAYEGVVGEGGSTSVFTGVGVLLLVLAGSYAIDKFTQNF